MWGRVTGGQWGARGGRLPGKPQPTVFIAAACDRRLPDPLQRASLKVAG